MLWMKDDLYTSEINRGERIQLIFCAPVFAPKHFFYGTISLAIILCLFFGEQYTILGIDTILGLVCCCFSWEWGVNTINTLTLCALTFCVHPCMMLIHVHCAPLSWEPNYRCHFLVFMVGKLYLMALSKDMSFGKFTN